MRNRLITVLFLPIAVFLWMIGWAMFWTGSRREQETQQEISPEDESITIIPMIPEEPEQWEA